MKNFEKFSYKEDVIVVVLTTSTNQKDVDLMKLNPRVKDFLNKPLTENKLQQLIENYFPR